MAINVSRPRPSAMKRGERMILLRLRMISMPKPFEEEEEEEVFVEDDEAPMG